MKNRAKLVVQNLVKMILENNNNQMITTLLRPYSAKCLKMVDDLTDEDIKSKIDWFKKMIDYIENGSGENVDS